MRLSLALVLTNARWCPFESRGNSDLACRSDEGLTPLAMAATDDLANVTYLLLDAGANPRATAFGAPLMSAAALPYPQLETLLIQHGADPTLRDWQGRTAADYRTAAPRTSNKEPRTQN
jgi:ankyrin repeat protein